MSVLVKTSKPGTVICPHGKSPLQLVSQPCIRKATSKSIIMRASSVPAALLISKLKVSNGFSLIKLVAC